MRYRPRVNTRSFLRQPRVLFFSLSGTLTAGVAASLGSTATQTAVHGVLVSLLFGATLALIEKLSQRDASISELASLARTRQQLLADAELSEVGELFSRSLIRLSRETDPVLRSTAAAKLVSICNDAKQISEGRFTYHGTEAWRNVYNDLLRSEVIAEYHSAAWMQRADYWQDPAGRRSIEANYEAVRRGVRVERVVILPSGLWPAEQLPPTDEALPWLVEQHQAGVSVLVCLEDDIRHEPDLPMDFGVYGDRAVGVQQLDDRCRTESFELSFDREEVQLAAARWRRLKLHATPLRELLDRTGAEA